MVVRDALDYSEWIMQNEAPRSFYPQLQAKMAEWRRRPLISVLLPTFNTPDLWLRRALDSVMNQLYQEWELCIADDCSSNPSVRATLSEYVARDPRIKVVYRSTNGHISRASNSALEQATGEYSALLDHDDELHPLALYYIGQTINDHQNAALIYTDEDKIRNDAKRFEPYFKPDFNYDLFLGQNMICHLGVYSTKVLRAIGGFRPEFDGSQDYDLALRVLDYSGSSAIYHVPRVLYHWRIHEHSTALASEAKPYAYTAAVRAISDHLKRAKVNASVVPAPGCSAYSKVVYALPENPPSVEIIIPTRDGYQLLQRCIASLRSKTEYSEFRITIIDNGSKKPETRRLLAELSMDSRIAIRNDDAPFNYSALNNKVALFSSADLVCLMNDDIEVINPDWLTEMVSIAVQPGVGCVGAKLLYPDRSIQHAGVILGIGGVAGHSHKRLSQGAPCYFARTKLRSTMSAVTGACLLVRQSIFKEVGGFNEGLKIAFNDVDFCLRVRNAGYRNVWTPYAELYHYESATRGYEDTPEKQKRFQREVDYMKMTWGAELANDPCYSPNLTIETEDFSLAWPARVGWSDVSN